MMMESCRGCTVSEAECAAFCLIQEEQDVPMVLHTQYRVLLRHEEAGWLTLVTDDRQDCARAEFERMARTHGRYNVKLVSETRYCEPADFL